jgi:hypothetical protein
MVQPRQLHLLDSHCPLLCHTTRAQLFSFLLLLTRFALPMAHLSLQLTTPIVTKLSLPCVLTPSDPSSFAQISSHMLSCFACLSSMMLSRFAHLSSLMLSRRFARLSSPMLKHFACLLLLLLLSQPLLHLPLSRLAPPFLPSHQCLLASAPRPLLRLASFSIPIIPCLSSLTTLLPEPVYLVIASAFPSRTPLASCKPASSVGMNHHQLTIRLSQLFALRPCLLRL